MKYLMRALSAAKFMAEWYLTAPTDGQITVNEMVDLVKGLSRIFNWTLDIKI